MAAGSGMKMQRIAAQKAMVKYGPRDEDGEGYVIVADRFRSRGAMAPSSTDLLALRERSTTRSCRTLSRDDPRPADRATPSIRRADPL